MDETIADIQEEARVRKKIRTDIKNFNRIKRDLSKSKTRPVKEVES